MAIENACSDGEAAGDEQCRHRGLGDTDAAGHWSEASEPDSRRDGNHCARSAADSYRYVSVPRSRSLVRYKTSLVPILAMISGWAEMNRPSRAASLSSSSS